MADVEASVIIPAHNAAATIGRQLEGLVDQKGAPRFEVIVVANRCTDETAAVAQGFADRLDISVLVADDVASAAFARNAGAAAAKGRFLLFCDADDQVMPGWVSGMIEPLAAGKADFVGGKLVVDRSGLADWIYEWRYAFLDGRCIQKQPGRLPSAVSASLGIAASAFRQVGGFDAAFAAAGGEEVDLARRLLRGGCRIGDAPHAEVLYAPRLTFRSNLAQARAYASGLDLLLRKEGAVVHRPSGLSVLVQVLRVVVYQLVRKKNRNPRLVYALARQRLAKGIDKRAAGPGPDEELHLKEPQDDVAVELHVPLIGGLAFRVGSALEVRRFERTGIVEPGSLALVERLSPRGGTFVDVGANVGLFAVAAAHSVGSEGRVFAFEPGSGARDCLRTNLIRHRVSDIVTVRPQAVGAEAGTQTFCLYENSLLSGFGLAADEFGSGEVLREEEIDVVELSSEINEPVDVLKVDVEGYEADVLRGAAELIRRSPKLSILFELNPAALNAAGRSASDVIGLLPAELWDLWLVDEQATEPDGVLQKFDRPAWEASTASALDPRWYANVLATRRSGTNAG